MSRVPNISGCCENSLGHHRSSGCIEVQSHRRGEGSSFAAAGTNRSVGGGQRASSAISRRFVGRCSTFFFLRKTPSPAYLRRATHEVVAIYVAEAFMWKVKELDEFVERRQRLGRRTQPAKPDPPSTVPTPKADPKKKPNKGAGKGQKNSEAPTTNEEASSSQH